MISDYQIRNPRPTQFLAMNADVLSRQAEAEAVRSSVKALGQATSSPNRDSVPASYPDGEQIRREPVAMEDLGRNVHEGWNTPEGSLVKPRQGSYELHTMETHPALLNISPRGSTVESDPQSYINPHFEHVDGIPVVMNSRQTPQPQHIFTGYDHNQDIEGHKIDGPSPYSSTQSTIPKPPTPRYSLSSNTLPPRSTSPIREIPLIFTICAAMFLAQSGLAQSIAPLRLISSTFTSPTHLPSPSWYTAAYSLTFGTFILPSGRLGDMYGVKTVFVIGWIWFTVASLGAGFNPRIVEGTLGSGETFFCFCRAMQGIGPALLMPNGLAILGRSYEGERKNMAFALFGACGPMGFVVGSVMASLLAEKVHWSWAYWGLAIACAVMGVVSVAIVPSFPGMKEATKEDHITMAPMWKRLDIPGTVFGVTGLILINVALNQAPIVSWSTPYTYFLLIIGLIILSFFFFIEFIPFLTPYPLIPLTILSLDTCFVLGCIACGWGTFGIWIFYLWDFLEMLRGLSSLLASAQVAPVAISGLLAAVTTGILLSKTTPQVIMVLSMFAFFLGTTLIATAPVDQVYWAQTFFSVIITPWGMDMSFPAAAILLSSKVGREHQGVAMSLVNTVLNYSISVGLGLAGTVQSNVDKDGTNVLAGFRGAWHFGMGLSGTGVLVAVTFVAITAWRAKKYAMREEEEVREV
jgi:MFS family permease